MQSNNAYALLIGITSYQHMPHLPKSSNDAKDLYDVLLQSGYPAANVRILLDGEATKENIDRELNWLAGSVVDVDATVIIFFSGHGIQRKGGFKPGEYLCPVDAQVSLDDRVLISDGDIARALQRINTTRLAVFLDACHAGGVGTLQNIQESIESGLSDKAYDNMVQGSGRVIITSCLVKETSYALSNMGTSLFTHFLLEGLLGAAANREGAIYITKLFSHIRQGLDQYRLQHPFQKAATEDFVIAYAGASIQIYARFIALEREKLKESYNLFVGEGAILDRHCDTLLDLLTVLYHSTQRTYRSVDTSDDFPPQIKQHKNLLLEKLREIDKMLSRDWEWRVKKFSSPYGMTDVGLQRQRENISRRLASLQEMLAQFIQFLQVNSLIGERIQNAIEFSLLPKPSAVFDSAVKSPSADQRSNQLIIKASSLDDIGQHSERLPITKEFTVDFSNNDHRTKLLNFMKTHYTEQRLIELCYNLNIVYDIVKASTHIVTIINIIEHEKTPIWQENLIKCIKEITPFFISELSK